MYVFNSKKADGQSLIPIINLMLGDNVIGAELGVARALTTCTLIQNCPKIKKLYAIDKWEPYKDYIKIPYDNNAGMDVKKADIEFIKLTALHNIKYSGFADRIQVMNMDSREAVKQIEDDSLDFIFLDAHLTIEQLDQDLHDWFSKVKTNGMPIIR